MSKVQIEVRSSQLTKLACSLDFPTMVESQDNSIPSLCIALALAFNQDSQSTLSVGEEKKVKGHGCAS